MKKKRGRATEANAKEQSKKETELISHSFLKLYTQKVRSETVFKMHLIDPVHPEIGY